MYNRSDLRAELARDEGYRLSAYRDSLGYWTIGIGHLLGDVARMTSITPAEAEALLNADIDVAERLARSVVPLFDGMNDVRQRALVNMAFNRGQHLVTSTQILPAIVQATKTNLTVDWIAVAVVIANSQWAQQVGSRAARLGFMFEKGETP